MDTFNGPGRFEGPEKVLEIWFTRSPSININVQDGEHQFWNAHNDKATTVGKSDLRIVTESQWKRMLNVCQCQIISKIQTDQMDAYMLSESSMVVFSDHIMLKTCGTTKLLLCLPQLLALAALSAGFAIVKRLVYSRKSFFFPEEQPAPHRSWEDEVHLLNLFFDADFSSELGCDIDTQWHLFLSESSIAISDVFERILGKHKHVFGSRLLNSSNTLPRVHHLSKHALPENNFNLLSKPLRHAYNYKAKSSCGQTQKYRYETLQIMMVELAPESAQYFYSSEYERCFRSAVEGQDCTRIRQMIGRSAADESGISKLFPRAQFPKQKEDHFMFEPCGYSANAIISSAGGGDNGYTTWTRNILASENDIDYYYTVHVTPEPHCSYASFETNYPSTSAAEKEALINKVLDIFKPRKCTIVWQSYKDSNGICNSQVLSRDHTRCTSDASPHSPQLDTVEPAYSAKNVIEQHRPLFQSFKGYEIADSADLNLKNTAIKFCALQSSSMIPASCTKKNTSDLMS